MLNVDTAKTTLHGSKVELTDEREVGELYINDGLVIKKK